MLGGRKHMLWYDDSDIHKRPLSFLNTSIALQKSQWDRDDSVWFKPSSSSTEYATTMPRHIFLQRTLLTGSDKAICGDPSLGWRQNWHAERNAIHNFLCSLQTHSHPWRLEQCVNSSNTSVIPNRYFNLRNQHEFGGKKHLKGNFNRFIWVWRFIWIQRFGFQHYPTIWQSFLHQKPNYGIHMHTELGTKTLSCAVNSLTLQQSAEGNQSQEGDLQAESQTITWGIPNEKLKAFTCLIKSLNSQYFVSACGDDILVCPTRWTWSELIPKFVNF